MKKQTFELNKMGLLAMSESEMKIVDGGNLWTWILTGVGAVVGFLVGGVGGAFTGAMLGFAAGVAIDTNLGLNTMGAGFGPTGR
ncbi:MAG: hypothetical protein K2Q21_14600 [Chitinophagaceae bacterium]|nr:hypothetical protein [Chitinophagaceae bacterium]